MRKTLDEAIKECGGFNIVSGMGDDSAMMIAECYERGYEPDSIIFCDTGNEWPRTYKFLAHLSMWMMSRSWSKLVVLRKKNGDGNLIDVYSDNFKNGRMPPPVYGFKSCSMKFKTEVANRYLAHDHLKNGKVSWKGWENKIIKAVGINADEEKRINSWQEDECFEQVFPLVDWDIGEHEAKDTVERVGLYLPGKSSCFMCPNATAAEIVELHDKHPLLFHKAIAMEMNVAESGNDKVEVERVFVVDENSGSECKLEQKMVKKIDKAIDLEKTLESIPKQKKIKLGLISENEQAELFESAKSKLVIKKVTEQTNFVGLGRKCSWLDVVKSYQMTGQIDFINVGGDMCGKTECGT